jgi:hypothetical protein
MPPQRLGGRSRWPERRSNTLIGPLRASGSYRIIFEKEAYEGLFSLAHVHEPAFHEACELLATSVSHAPDKWIPGKLKALTGTHKGIWQLSLGGGNRVWYTIDVSAKLVYVEYCGKHPNWK